MGLSEQFRQELQTYKFEKKFGTLKSNREHLLRVLKDGLCRKCENDLPQLAYHSLWGLSDGSLGLIIHEQEVRNMAGHIQLHFMEAYNNAAVLWAAANNNLWVAPVYRQLQAGYDGQIVENLASLELIPVAVMRELRRIYILHLDNELFYAYLKKERKISSAELVACLGQPQVERWRFSKKNRLSPPADF